MTICKPPRLRVGDTVAVLSPSWGGPATFPHVHEAGVRVLQDTLGLRVREYPTTRAPAAWLADNPRARAEDLLAALRDPDVRAVFASIGGDDSVRLLQYLDPAVLRDNPKPMMGFSDTTTLLTWGCQAGVVTFHGPAVMAGIAQLGALPPAASEHLRAMLFDARDTHAYEPFMAWSEGYPDWSDPATVGQVNPLRSNPGWTVLQGRGVHTGTLYGGCLDVLECIKGTRHWPQPGFWRGVLFFVETSEEAPAPGTVRRWLRNYGMQGVFDQVAGLLVGRPRGYTDAQRRELSEMLVGVVAGEFQRPDLPIAYGMDLGHTDPQWVLPLGVRAAIDCDALRFTLLESPVA